MTLTEQWKKGERPEGYYYIKLPSGKMEIISHDSFQYLESETIKNKTEVLAPVPSYEDWQELNKQRNQFIRDIKDLAHIQEENQRLKDVISKMCMELVDPDDDMSNGLAEYFNQDLLLEIHEVLK